MSNVELTMLLNQIAMLVTLRWLVEQQHDGDEQQEIIAGLNLQLNHTTLLVEEYIASKDVN